jgi:hypothetical protein
MPIEHELMSVSPFFRYALHDAAVFEHDVMRRNLAVGRAQPLQRVVAGRHAGVVQQDHVRRAAVLALVVIGRRHHLGDNERIRPKQS